MTQDQLTEHSITHQSHEWLKVGESFESGRDSPQCEKHDLGPCRYQWVRRGCLVASRAALIVTTCQCFCTLVCRPLDLLEGLHLGVDFLLKWKSERGCCR
jgi:hypothetical protein